MRRLLAAVCVVAGSVVVPMAAPAAAGGGGCHSTEVTESSGSTVELRNNCFTPTILRIAPGTTVTFVNADEVDHAVSGVNLGAYEELAPGASAQVRFDDAGTYPYMCHIHPTMSGVAVVGDGRGTERAEPVLASTDRPAPAPEDDSGVSPVVVVAAAAAAGAFGFVAARRTRKESAPEA